MPDTPTTTERDTPWTPGEWGLLLAGGHIEVGSLRSRTPVVNWSGFDDADRPKAEHVANARLIAASPRLYAELKAVEWDGHFCPSCKRRQDQGHRPDCSLAAALASALSADAPGKDGGQ